MRIVHAIRSDGFAGVERHVARLAAEQARRGDTVLVVGGRQDAMASALANTGVRRAAAARTMDVARAIRSSSRNADVVHTHMTAAEVGTTLAGASGRRLPPVVTTRHFAGPRGSGPGSALVAAVGRHRVDVQIAISRYVAESVDGPSVVVHPGVLDQPAGLSVSDRRRTIVMLQRLEPEKRTGAGMHAFAASGLAAHGWSLEIAGDGSERGELEVLAGQLGIATAVTFLGHQRDTEPLLRTASILLAPCDVEGLGLSVLEAMSYGLPVVASAAGGHLETLEGLDPLALFTPGDVESAGTRLRSLARDPSRREAYASAARSAQRTRFTVEAQASATAAVYRSVL